ncbi:bifunctional diguanylate cyclase/phosphodiesterase [Paucibacter sp. KBW04]|uniref:putative bifunctional diguanylate cyclase/phosphodiesterase n=1 Tax=Paucibacter sp. KBW04 TaxID=2153361 RepID=UPI0018CC7163|nr:bifunctional diguanylate cyclase/phosphodiesterase [Paucibacter sp. KBW04]
MMPPLTSLNWVRLRQLAFCVGLGLVTHTLWHHPSAWMRGLYLLYPAAMLLALWGRRLLWRRAGALLASALLVGGALLSPLGIEVIEESFILCPLLLILLFPGSLWPIPFSVCLLLPYYLGLEAGDLEGFIEDAVELLLITSFAASMALFQQRTQRQAEAYRKDSLTDYLTALENRPAFSAALRELDAGPAVERARYALLMLDMDDFKRVNDVLGHLYGDKLLRQFADRLRGLSGVRSFRLGGDEFAVLLLAQEDARAESEQLARRVLAKTQRAYEFEGRAFQVSVSVGIALADGLGSPSEDLSRYADLALYAAKSAGKNSYAFFTHELLRARTERDFMEQELRQAIARDQLHLLYQPKVELAGGRIVGVEALLRWQHPSLGLVSPARFIPLAEESRAIVEIGRWVLNEACAEAVRWQAQGYALDLSVNVSAVQLAHDDVVAAVGQALQLSGLAAERLELEITETSMMSELGEVLPILHELRGRGVKIALDDFGVAFSSLNQLSRLPLDTLKIDKAFVDQCVLTHRDHMIVRTVLQLGRNLALRVVAEGIESSAQAQLLHDEGCAQAQGFLFAPPLTPEALLARLRQQR